MDDCKIIVTAMPTVSVVVGTDVGFSTVGDCDGVEVGAWLWMSAERILFEPSKFIELAELLLSSISECLTAAITSGDDVGSCNVSAEPRGIRLSKYMI